MSWTWADHSILTNSTDKDLKCRQPMFDAMSFCAGFACEWGLNLGTYSLKSAKEYFGIESRGHRALDDAKDTVTILKNILEFDPNAM